MSRHAAIELEFGDDSYTFRLGLAEIEEIEQKRDASIFSIADRLSPMVRAPRITDITEVLRCGLIGGGMKPIEALKLVRRYVDQHQLDDSRDVAYAVAMAGLARVHGDELTEGDGAGKATAEPSGSTSPQSEQPQP